jgi:sigma 54 modulation/S30EA-like ribosomal protein
MDVTTGRQERRSFPAYIPRPAKRASDRQGPFRITAHVREMGVELDEEARSYIRRKLGMKLGKFAPSVERVSVRVFDVNGPRGGIDQRCLVKVVLSGLPSVVVERRHVSLDAAVAAAVGAAEHAVRRSVSRRRMKPLHRRNGSDLRSKSFQIDRQAFTLKRPARRRDRHWRLLLANRQRFSRSRSIQRQDDVEPTLP